MTTISPLLRVLLPEEIEHSATVSPHLSRAARKSKRKQLVLGASAGKAPSHPGIPGLLSRGLGVAQSRNEEHRTRLP